MSRSTSVFVAGASTMIGAAVVRRLQASPDLRSVGHEEEPALTEAAAVDRFLARVRPDAIILAAGAHAGIAGNQRRPADLMVDNLVTAVNVIAGAHRHGVRRLIYVASSCVYPKLAPQPLAVGSLWTGPVEPTSAAYATAKLAAMRLCEAMRQQYGAAYVTAIKADAYGPGDDFSLADSHVVAALIRRMHEAREAGAPSLSIWGTGAPRREFIYADDLADALVFVLQRYHGEAPINVGTGVTTSIHELAETLRGVIGFRGSLAFDRTRPDGMPLKGLDSSALAALGWRPSWTLERGLRSTYDWFLAHPEACEEGAAASS